jgi:aminoglycoside phosphotransferase family enzyme/predicted kinase
MYPHHSQKVALVQTQMSFIFLTGDYAYKVKKPVNLGYLDYTTLEKRHFFCQQEIELNRRLCPEVYLEVVPIVESEGRFQLGGNGEVVEYAVKMKQLPAEQMMDRLLPSDKVTEEMVTSIAYKLADFHQKARTSPEISNYGSLHAIKVNTEENFSQTEKYVGTSISHHVYSFTKDYTNKFMEEHKELFQKRVAEGRIRDCHGDLHAAHVCFTNGICIYDCIEFNDRFRYGDVASEVAFLAMDLDRFNRADLSRVFVDAYVQASGDKELLKLLAFYKCYRAYVRGKVESFKLDDPFIADKDTALEAARSYFRLAYRYARGKKLLFIVAGLVGTGKTTVAQALGRSLGLTVISSDIVRKELAGIPPTERRFEPISSGIYSEEFTRRTYQEMFTRAKSLLLQGGSVIMDASFKQRQHRLEAKKLAEAMDADFAVLECVLDEPTVKNRLEQRVKEGSVSDGRWEVYLAQKDEFEKIDEIPSQQHIVLDTAQQMSNIVTIVARRLWGE